MTPHQKKTQEKPQNPQPSESVSTRVDWLREMLGEDAVGIEWTVKLLRKDESRDRTISGVSVLPGLMVTAARPRAVEILKQEIVSKVAGPAASYIQEEINADLLARTPERAAALALPAPAGDVVAEEAFGGLLDAEAAKAAADLGNDLEEDDG